MAPETAISSSRTCLHVCQLQNAFRAVKRLFAQKELWCSQEDFVKFIQIWSLVLVVHSKRKFLLQIYICYFHFRNISKNVLNVFKRDLKTHKQSYIIKTISLFRYLQILLWFFKKKKIYLSKWSHKNIVITTDTMICSYPSSSRCRPECPYFLSRFKITKVQSSQSSFWLNKRIFPQAAV